MATYNGERFIKEAIDSILNQTFSDFEFIIVDDGSTDSTAQRVASYTDDRIIYIKKDSNSGIADSLNIGIAKAKGHYIARMDDDDVALPNRLMLQLEAFDNNDTLIVCGSNVWLQDGAKERVNPETHEAIQLQMLFENPITHPSVMITKAVLLKHPYDSEKVPSEDYDLWSRLLFEGEFYNIQQPLLYYRYHKQSETSMRRNEQLQLSVSIVDFMFKKLGFDVLEYHDYNLKAFVSHDYSINASNLKNLVSWFKSLKALNAHKKVFSTQLFNKVADKHLDKFLISYFTNRSVSKKVMPFFKIAYTHKLVVLNYYLKKIIT